MPAWFAYLWPLAAYAVLLGLHVLVPAREVDGYVVDPTTGRPYRYRLNGLRVAVLAVAGWAGLCAAGVIGWGDLWVHRWESAAGACALGLAFTAWIVLPAPAVPGQSWPAALFLGRRENPQWRVRLPGLAGGRVVDAKMVLYLVGAVLLELNLLSSAMYHSTLYEGAASPGVWLHVALFSFFVCEYLWFEEVHLYTYDFFAERVGFKLGWGCLVFYPYFYAVPAFSTAALPDPGRGPVWLAASALTFFGGWMLSRGANLQKFHFKRDPTRAVFGIRPVAVEADGHKLLVSGFWGISRHVNYLGEILMATGLALALGYPGELGPWLYPLYYVALLVPRQIDDDRRCAAKYGALWAEYCRRVPARIVPGLY